jgi:hypothetical protein
MEQVLQDFLTIYQKQIGGVTMMLYAFHRKNMLIDVVNFFKRNRRIYM